MKPFCALLGVILLGATLLGQTLGNLRGQVLDELGAVIKGATVTLVAKDGKKRTATTNANGEFSVPNLSPGIYTLMVEFKDFQTYVENGINPASTTAPLKISLKVASVTESTDVSAEGSGISVEPDQNMTGIVLDEKMIEDLLPDNEDDMTEFLQALAGGTGNAQILIDGFNGGHLPPREAIMQIRINQNPFSAEYSSGGSQGRIEIITKPGLGDWRGNISIGLRNSALDARNA
ncbi:MAG: carboxypeptidase regulatory-like domain-containing protein, partial [Blastocatellia bacterium]|nr:carboxypeptidase regulatory-like domain-containing protein [Blastocatellia bacterium]